MGRILLKLTRGGRTAYLEWSTVADAPVTFGMTLDELRDYVESRYGTDGLNILPERLKRCDERGHSALRTAGEGEKTWEEYVDGNRAGPNESDLTPDQIWEWYVVKMESPK